MNYSKIFLTAFFIVMLNLFLFKAGVIEYFDYKSYDILSELTTKKNDSKSSVVVVDIDEKSLESLGQWPWSRVILAQLISQINSAKPSSIGIDIIFPEKDKTSPIAIKEFYKNFFSLDIDIKKLPSNLIDNDLIFSNALSNSKVAMALFLSDNYKKRDSCEININSLKIKDDLIPLRETQNILCNIELLQKSSTNSGFINASVDRDGIFRRVYLFMKYKDKTVPALSLATMMNVDELILDKNKINILGRSISVGDYSEVMLRFYNKSWYKKVSAVDILTNKVDKEVFKGKFVLIGTSAVGLHDRFIASNGENIAGIDVHATLIDNILLNDLIHELSYSKLFGFVVANILLLILLYLMFAKRYMLLLVSFLSICIVFFVISYLFLLNNIYMSSGFFFIPFGVGFFVINFIAVIMNYLEKRGFYKEISKAHSSAIDSMALVVERRDTETGAHIKRTKEYIKLLCEYMVKNDIYKNILTKEFVELIYRASPLHDIGKVGIPDNVLKKPAKLSYEEFEVMKTHAIIGKEILENALVEHANNKFLAMAKNIAHYHHEKWDGSGYPEGLKGLEIPLEARMMALADVYDALISKRAYKESLGFEFSEKIIIDGTGSHFDPILVGVFIEIKDKFKDIALKIQE